MGKAQQRTNAMRILDSRGVAYQVLKFSPDIHSGSGVAEAVGVPSDTVFKTLVVLRPKGKGILVMLPANQELDLKKLASSLGERKLQMASHRQAEALTNLQVGGISALALLSRPFDVFIVSEALQHAEILVSAGRRGINLRLGVPDLIDITGAEVIDLSA